MNRKVRTVLLVVWAALLLGACSGMLTSQPSNVNKVDQVYIDAENKLGAAYDTLYSVALAEKAARARGEPPGTIITKQQYEEYLSVLDRAKGGLRLGRSMSDSECLVYATMSIVSVNEAQLEPDGPPCYGRQAMALLILEILTKLNEEEGL